MERDLFLINKIKESNDEECLMELISRHSGIYVYIVDKFSKNENPLLDKELILQDKDYMIYKSALTYNPNCSSKFSTYLANEAKWTCLNHMNKKRRLKETDMESIHHEPVLKETAFDNIVKGESLEAFTKMLSEEKDFRVKKIIDIRYNTSNNKLIPWRIVASKLKMSIQGCINIHDKFIQKVKKELNKQYV
jgi:DNA-directed RNA polymerase specialized sigma24 family protein